MTKPFLNCFHWYSFKTFFYAYGFELLKEYVPYKELEETYETEKKMLEVMKKNLWR